MNYKSAVFKTTLTLLVSSSAYASPDFYGKFNVSVHNHDNGSANLAELRNNFSRLGFRGEQDLGDEITAIYQYELEFNPDDASLFSQRNVFLGLKSYWGTLKAGHFDTALKSSQGPVDLFNDMIGDFANVITISDNRTSNTVAYSSPVLAGGLTATVHYTMREDETLDDGISTSLVYSRDAFYLAAAHEVDVEEQGASDTRVTAAYVLGSLQVGGVFMTFENDAGESQDGWLASGLYKVGSWDLKLQHGNSDIVYEGGTTTSIGADYHVNEMFSYTSYVTQNESDDGLDDFYVGVGAYLKF